LEFSQQGEQHQNAQEGRLGGEELLQAEIISSQVRLQLLNPLLHSGPLVVKRRSKWELPR
jgi:hypothetical protein